MDESRLILNSHLINVPDGDTEIRKFMLEFTNQGVRVTLSVDQDSDAGDNKYRIN